MLVSGTSAELQKSQRVKCEACATLDVMLIDQEADPTGLEGGRPSEPFALLPSIAPTSAHSAQWPAFNVVVKSVLEGGPLALDGMLSCHSFLI
jgi:hypothetical protein